VSLVCPYSLSLWQIHHHIEKKKKLKKHKANNKDMPFSDIEKNGNGDIGTDREQVTLVMLSYEPNVLQFIEYTQ